MREGNRKSSVVLAKDDDLVVATDVCTGIASQGNTEEEALENLKEALDLYYEDNPATKAALAEYDEMRKDPSKYQRYDSIEDALKDIF